MNEIKIKKFERREQSYKQKGKNIVNLCFCESNMFLLGS